MISVPGDPRLRNPPASDPELLSVFGNAAPASSASPSPRKAPGLSFDIATAVFVTATYFLAACYGLGLLANPNGVAVFWPASGIAVGTLIAIDRRVFWPIGLGIAIGTVAANLAAGRAFVLTIPFAAANMIECYCAGWIAHRLLGSDLRFDSLKRVSGLFLAAAVGTALSAVIGAGTFFMVGTAGEAIFQYWQEWFRADLIGIIAIMPFILGVKALFVTRLSARGHLEGVALLVLVLGVAALIFPGLQPHALAELRMPEALLFPPLLLLAIRRPITYSPIGASLVALAIVASTISQGAIVEPSAILWTQATIVSLVGCSLLLAALIAERRGAESRQRLLIAELNHRVKNGLALVQAVVERSRENAFSIDDFYGALAGRIDSMARTHSLLSREKWQGLSLREVVETELRPYQMPGKDAVDGPEVILSPALAQSFSLVLHELSTNAAKHGALSRPEGRVTVKWSIERMEEAEKDLAIEWRESGAPPPKKMGPQSFGTTIIRNLLTYEANAVITLSFPAEGARCTIRLPMAGADIRLA